MTLRPCLSCGIATKATRCPACTSERNIARGSSTKRGYTSRWRRISAAQRRRVPYCELRLPGCTFLADAADHIVPLEQGGKSTAGNARSACTACNNRRRHTEKAMPAVPTCEYCTRPYADPRGCEYLDDDTKPVKYGEELDPLSTTPTCRDCAAPLGTEHHVACTKAECPTCHGQWFGCFGHHEVAA